MRRLTAGATSNRQHIARRHDGGATGLTRLPCRCARRGTVSAPNTCAEFEQDDYTMCLHPDTAALCGYHVVHATSQKEKDADTEITCKPCSPGGLCPGGPRIWPQAGYWVADERPPTVESGRSADPLACPAPSHKRCLEWDVDTRTTKCGSEYEPGVYLCAECKRGYYSTLWNRSCSPCIVNASDSNDDGQNIDVSERMIVVACLLSFLSFLALCVVLAAVFVGGDRGQSIPSAPLFLLFSVEHANHCTDFAAMHRLLKARISETVRVHKHDCDAGFHRRAPARVLGRHYRGSISVAKLHDGRGACDFCDLGVAFLCASETTLLLFEGSY